MAVTVILFTLVTLFIPSDTTPEVTGGWCDLRAKVMYHPTPNELTTFYSSVKTAKVACEDSSECGAVVLDKPPLRNAEGEVVHEHKIYLVSKEYSETRTLYTNYRFNTFLKGIACEDADVFDNSRLQKDLY